MTTDCQFQKFNRYKCCYRKFAEKVVTFNLPLILFCASDRKKEPSTINVWIQISKSFLKSGKNSDFYFLVFRTPNSFSYRLKALLPPPWLPFHNMLSFLLRILQLKHFIQSSGTVRILVPKIIWFDQPVKALKIKY